MRYVGQVEQLQALDHFGDYTSESSLIELYLRALFVIVFKSFKSVRLHTDLAHFALDSHEQIRLYQVALHWVASAREQWRNKAQVVPVVDCKFDLFNDKVLVWN